MFDSHFLRYHHNIHADILPRTYRILPNETIKSIHEKLDTRHFPFNPASVQIRSFFWSVFSRIRTRKNS